MIILMTLHVVRATCKGPGVSVSSSSPLMSVLVYNSQLLAEESEVIDDTRALGRSGRLFLIHLSMSASS
jgi:hypothetical protein